ncbi:hypothetical protein J3E68DRAFT_178330 [Trichoderma sp. SZMC 28012]
MKRRQAKGCPGGSEIVPHSISSHLSKNYATLPPANWVLGGPVALWRLVQRNWGPDWRVRRVWRVCKAKISSPRLAPPLGALGGMELTNKLLSNKSSYCYRHECEYILDMGPVASPSKPLHLYPSTRTSFVPSARTRTLPTPSSGGYTLGPVLFPKLSSVPVRSWPRHTLDSFFVFYFHFKTSLEATGLHSRT